MELTPRVDDVETIATRDVEEALVGPVPDDHALPAAGVGHRSIGRFWPSISTLPMALGLPLALYAVLRPENYGLTPNSLDPVFYSGYAINFDDVINAVGDRHYFVSRWSAYYPGYVANAIAGPFVGRLLLRLLLASAILLAIWSLGSRWRWSRAQQLLVGGLVLTMPMFIRAFFTDYVEYLVVALGICLVCLCLRKRQGPASATSIGLLSGLIVVANPIAVSLVGFCLVAALLGASTTRGRLLFAAVVAASAAFVVVGGLVVFRWRYGIDNVYEPSLDFIRNYRAQPDDPWKAPAGEWLATYTWLYAAPIVVLATLATARRRAMKLDRFELGALALCAAQYAYQWVDQFFRGGYGLELSFYWSFSYPTFAVALAVMVGRFTKDVQWRPIAAVGAGWLVLMLVRLPDVLRLPKGVLFGVLAVVVLAAATALVDRRSVTALAMLVALVGWTQVGAPHPDLSSRTYVNSPKYDELFRRAGDASELVYSEAVWFAQEMDRIPNDASTSFVAYAGWSLSIVGIYAPHVVGRVVTLEDGGDRLTRVAVAEIKSGLRPILAVFGPPPHVERMLSTFPSDLGVGTELLDVTHDTSLGYRLVVFAMPDSATLPFTWTADILPRLTGHVVDTEVVVNDGDKAGYVTFGPYLPLQPARYQVTLHYRSTADQEAIAGSFEVSSTEIGTVSTVELPGTAGATSQATLTFTVNGDLSDPRWEFRTNWAGLGEMVVEKVSLSAG